MAYMNKPTQIKTPATNFSDNIDVFKYFSWVVVNISNIVVQIEVDPFKFYLQQEHE